MKTTYPVMLVAGVVLGLSSGGCIPPGDQSTLVDRTVTVGAGGGFAGVKFNATSGQIIRITLTGSPATMEPYGDLLKPDDTNSAAPPNGSSSGGVNTIDVTLTQTGQYTLGVFDGANLGGSVHVVIKKL
jgi:hypothetical protein